MTIRLSRILSSSLAAGMVAFLLASCGGGGGGNETPPPPVAPSITTPPQDVHAVAGERATFTVTASGTQPLSYQWKRNGTDIGADSNTYTTPILGTSDNNAKFSVTVTNIAGHEDSAEATLTVAAAPVAPTITVHPQNRSVTVGQTATFTVTATGTATLSYQWKRGTANVGTNAATYTTPATTLADNGATYSVVVTNTAGHADSNAATLTVAAVPVAPTITAHPQNRTVTVGQTATFTVTATGTATLNYQWKRGSTNVGTNAATYTTPATTLADNGATYSVVVTNTAGHADSNAATLTVNPSTGSAIIINHTHTNLPQVPSSAITAAKNSLHIAYGHTSHGSQLITGMGALAASQGSPYTFNNGGSGGALDLEEAWGFDLGNPNFTQWAASTRTYLASHTDVNVVIWSWCGQVSSASTANIDTYLSLMNQLETDFPGVKFVYMTGHLDGSGTGGTLNTNNNRIRTYCQNNNKILFDFADIESYDPTGSTNYMALGCDDGCNYDSDGNGSRDRNWATVWLGNHPSDPLTVLANQCGGCAHSETLNCVLKGRAAWWLWARLAGWNGQ